MLDRASSCLELRLRCSRILRRRAQANRRLLHTSFWDHGGNAFDLPPYALPNTFDAASCNKNDANVADDLAKSHDAPLLEFLYPPQALALLARPIPRALEKSAQKRAWSGHRRFSSLPRVESRDGVRFSQLNTSPGQSPLDALPKVLGRNLGKRRQSSEARAQDQSRSAPVIIPSEDASSNEDTWHKVIDNFLEPHLGLLPDASRINTVSKQGGILLHRDRAKGARVRLRASIGLNGDELHDQEIYRDRLDILTSQGHLDQAEQLIRLAINQKMRLDFGARHLFRSYALNKRWSEAASLFQEMADHAEAVEQPQILEPLEDELAQVQTKHDTIEQILRALTRPNALDTNPLRGLLNRIVRTRLRRLDSIKHRPSFVRRLARVSELASLLQNSGAGSMQLYETMLQELLDLRQVPDRLRWSQTVANVWSQASMMLSFQPSTTVMIAILEAWKDGQLSDQMDVKDGVAFHPRALEKVWRQMYGDLNYLARLSFTILSARSGSVREVERLTKEYVKSASGKPLDPMFFWPYIQVHAVRGDAAAARSAFKRLREDFHVEPTAQTWDMLLLAHERSDNLDGLLDIFYDRLDAKLTITPHAFSLLMTLYAQRGSPEVVTDLMGLAEQHGLRVDTHMATALLVAHANAGDDFAAEQLLKQIVAQNRKGRIPGPLTLCYNSVLLMYALRRDSVGVTRLQEQMKRDHIPFDEATFGALILLLVSRRNPDRARVILKHGMAAQHCIPGSLHYSLVMTGFVKLGELSKASDIWRQIQEAGLRPTAAAHAAYLRLAASQASITKGGGGKPYTIDETVAELLDALDQDTASTQPTRIGQKSLSMDVIAVSVFETAIYIHGEKKSLDAAWRLFNMYRSQPGKGQTDQEAPPIRLVNAMMKVYHRAGDKSQVEKCWELLLTQATKMIEVRRPDLAKLKPTTEAILDSDVETSEGTDGISDSAAKSTALQDASNMRLVLSAPLRTYMSSKFSSPSVSPSTVTSIVNTVLRLLRQGFDLDNRTWNALIVHLCKLSPPRATLAYFLTERFLINDFRWERPRQFVPSLDLPGYPRPNKSRRVEGTQLIAYPKRFPAATDRLPLYPTMVRLAHVLIKLQDRESQRYSSGQISVVEERELRAQVGSVADLQTRAPRTIARVRELPLIFDRLQTKLIHGGQENMPGKLPGENAWVLLGLGAPAKPQRRKRARNRRPKKRSRDLKEVDGETEQQNIDKEVEGEKEKKEQQ